jgi:hypothetical protein
MRAIPTFTAAGLVALLAGAALAQERPQSPALTCAQASALVQSRGALILGTGGYTYDRYVSSQASCQVDEFAEAAFVPTRDNPQCQAGYRCRGRTSRASGGGN